MCCGNENTNYVTVGSAEKICINPVSFILSKALREAFATGGNLTTTIETVLDRGYVSKNNADFCCQDCKDPTGFYFLGGSAAFATLVNDLPTLTNYTGAIECCINYEASVSTSVLIQNSIDLLATEPECCESTFRADLTTLESKFEDFSELLELGIVEVSTLNYKSSILEILNAIMAVNEYADPEFILEVFTEVLTSGVFVKCDSCSIIITNSVAAIATANTIF